MTSARLKYIEREKCINVNVNLYRCALSHSASNALGALSTAETDASSAGDRSWRRWDLDRADRCRMHSIRSDQPWRTHDGCTYPAVSMAWRAGGGSPNEGAVIKTVTYWQAHSVAILHRNHRQKANAGYVYVTLTPKSTIIPLHCPHHCTVDGLEQRSTATTLTTLS